MDAGSSTASHRARAACLRTCWLPPAAWLATWLYVRRFDGWGAWAAAPLFLPALLLSVIMGLAGLILLVTGLRRTHRLDPALLLATLLAASVVIILWLRSLLA